MPAMELPVEGEGADLGMEIDISWMDNEKTWIYYGML